VLNADVNSLGDDAVSDLLINNNSNGPGVNIEDSAGPTVIVFVGHTFVDGSIYYDINYISNFIGSESLGNMYSSVLLEPFFEFVSSSAFVSVAVGHGSQIIINNIIKNNHFISEANKRPV